MGSTIELKYNIGEYVLIKGKVVSATYDGCDGLIYKVEIDDCNSTKYCNFLEDEIKST